MVGFIVIVWGEDMGRYTLDKIGNGSLALRTEAEQKLSDIAHFLRTNPMAAELRASFPAVMWWRWAAIEVRP